ncbi:MAG: TIGR03546 family protein [Bacteriovoracaceae bacterium]|nr:TIGR03546 family protein [Bacteriovoracaceae bacterium]
MTLILKQLFAFLKLLNSDKGTNQIAAGISCGLILGFIPAFSLQTLVVFFILFLFRIQIGAAFLSAFFFAIPAYLLDSLFHKVGAAVLEVESLTPLYTKLYNMPILPFTKFNNSIVMGSFIVALALFPIVFLLSKVLVAKYRQLVVEKLKQTKWFKALKATSLYKWYYKYDQLY